MPYIFRDTHFQIIIIVIIGFYDFPMPNWIWMLFEELQLLEFFTGIFDQQITVINSSKLPYHIVWKLT